MKTYQVHSFSRTEGAEWQDVRTYRVDTSVEDLETAQRLSYRDGRSMVCKIPQLPLSFHALKLEREFKIVEWDCINGFR